MNGHYLPILNKSALILHLRHAHGHIDSVTEMQRWDRDQLERCHIRAHREEQEGVHFDYDLAKEATERAHIEAHSKPVYDPRGNLSHFEMTK